MSFRIEDVLQQSFNRHRDAIAIVDGDQTLSYQQLDERSSQVADVLRVAGLRRDDRVCLLTPKSADSISVVLGVLKAGGVYIPLDCASPAERISSMLVSCTPCWLVIDELHMALATQIFERSPQVMLQGTFELQHPFAFTASGRISSRAPRGVEADDPGPGDLAYILFTSGSTGQPKGVPITHRNVVEYIAWTNDHFQVKPEDRISSHSPLHFDMSVWDVFGTLAAGATLYLVPAEANLTPTLTAEFIRKSALTQWYSVPSVLVAIASRDVLEQADLRHLKRVIWGGEALPVRTLQYWMERLPHTVFTNVYGPTETTVNCTYYTVQKVPDDPAGKIPIGYPIPGRALRILDDDRQEVAPGQIGTLYSGGQGLSPGYWRDAAKTDAAFFNIPPGSTERWYRTGDLAHVDEQGVYHFHGRADRQVKACGHRIELDEVAAALSRLPQIADSAVVAIAVGGFEGARICAAYVSTPGSRVSAASLRGELGQLLPAYMLPRRWIELEKLPTNVNGKTDLTRLKDLFTDE
ncbi:MULTISPECIES: amino acid adenylation domain-containing protein [unclassified Pseudomonas]|uniref:amino acid adenylation domain-containing protein n=1 Tax=unclassified Pseudomonas TaxID=196821 RepID=UPI001A9ECBE1|nr:MULTISPECIES: amino acid adenylation domain-containing protein [unclassified Pseudomonas]